ncbi:MAG: amino acid ABC transporter permease [Armatimonadota bacterium]|nr:amino acid ABC transporter permease [Armatimonadota bacterium]MDR5697386.1 amino acid ABC transporter permease [Armatimonadota bacterium]
MRRTVGQAEMVAAAAAPARRLSEPAGAAVAWARQNLFSTWYNALLTLAALWATYAAGRAVVGWALYSAEWTVVQVNFRLFFVGGFPQAHIWRVWLPVALTGLLSGMSWAVWGRASRTAAIAVAAATFALAAVPLRPETRLWLVATGTLVGVGFWIGARAPRIGRWLLVAWLGWFGVSILLLRGVPGSALLPPVGTNLWNGLLLTVLLAVVGIVASFPLGVLLALGRRSQMPAMRLVSIAYIELVRGVPLITVLFMAQVMLPLFLPEGMRPDRVLRAMAGLVLFSAAYLAENVRGGLAAIPRGQIEAAQALGLRGPLVLGLVVLPQALRTVIPAIVGQFIALFKDTSLVAIVGLVDLLGVARSILAQPRFLGRYVEVYVFVAALYFLFTYVMSYGSRRLEKALGVGER